MSLRVKIPIDLRGSTDANASFEALSGPTTPFAAWTFDQSTDGIVRGLVLLPQALAADPDPSIVLVIASSATSGAARMNVSSKMVDPNGGSYSVALTADTAQDVTVPGAAWTGKKVTYTVGDLGSILQSSGGKHVLVEVTRDANHANDTLAADLALLDAWIEVEIA